MSVVIRLARAGTKSARSITSSPPIRAFPRDGRFIERLGFQPCLRRTMRRG